MKFNIKFNTIGGPQTVIYTMEELKNTDLERYAINLQALHSEGVISAIYDMPNYGRVEIEVVEFQSKIGTETDYDTMTSEQC